MMKSKGIENKAMKPKGGAKAAPPAPVAKPGAKKAAGKAKC